MIVVGEDSPCMYKNKIIKTLVNEYRATREFRTLLVTAKVIIISLRDSSHQRPMLIVWYNPFDCIRINYFHLVVISIADEYCLQKVYLSYSSFSGIRELQIYRESSVQDERVFPVDVAMIDKKNFFFVPWRFLWQFPL